MDIISKKIPNEWAKRETTNEIRTHDLPHSTLTSYLWATEDVQCKTKSIDSKEAIITENYSTSIISLPVNYFELYFGIFNHKVLLLLLVYKFESISMI